MTLQEVAREHGFVASSGPHPIFIYRGRVLDPEFTLHFHHITDGSTVIAYVRRPRPQLGPRIPGPLHIRWALMAEPQTREEICADESARLIDRNFLNWEMRKDYPGVLDDILKAYEMEEAKAAPLSREETIVAPISEISDRPLPQLSGPRNVGT
jgi:hypothetical protein